MSNDNYEFLYIEDPTNGENYFNKFWSVFKTYLTIVILFLLGLLAFNLIVFFIYDYNSWYNHSITNSSILPKNAVVMGTLEADIIKTTTFESKNNSFVFKGNLTIHKGALLFDDPYIMQGQGNFSISPYLLSGNDVIIQPSGYTLDQYGNSYMNNLTLSNNSNIYFTINRTIIPLDRYIITYASSNCNCLNGTNGVNGTNGLNGVNGTVGATGPAGPAGSGGGQVSSTTPLYTQMVYVNKNGSDTTGLGSINEPYLTIVKALSTILDATTTKRYTVEVGAGRFDEIGDIALVPYVWIIGRQNILTFR
jgi:hypothetical protein